MSTPATPLPPKPPSTIDRLLSILDIGLKTTAAIVGGPAGAGISAADALLQIGAHAKAAYEAETGQPYDLSKVPLEDHV